MNTAEASPASIFQLRPIDGSLPILNESLPLTLFCHADERLINSINRLKQCADGHSCDKFKRRMEKVHEAQRLLLTTLYILHLELDEEYKCSRDYRSSLPPQDRAELDSGYSENILFAAEALNRGFRIRGIERFTTDMVPAAQQLCATLEAVRAGLRARASNSIYPPYLDIFTIIKEFEVAWTAFEQMICHFYFTNCGKNPHRKEHFELFKALMDETVQRALDSALFTTEMMEACEPGIVLAIPRLSIVTGLMRNISKPGTSTDDASSTTSDAANILHILFNENLTELKELQTDFACLSDEDVRIVEKLLLSESDEQSEPVTIEADIKHVDLFKRICLIADELQGGHRAREFVEVLGKVFSAYQ